MAGKIAIPLLSDTTNQMNVTGSATRAAGYRGFSNGIMTVSVHLQDFVGRIYIQGSLASEPAEIDWFNINLQGTIPYMEYPKNPSNHIGPNGDTFTDAYTFQINAIWLRAIVDRSYLTNPEIGKVGTVKKMLLSY